jgi:hypothetical protein
MIHRLSFILIVVITFGCSNSTSEIQDAVADQLKRHPESALQDIYKSFFQDEFGPGHLIDNVSHAREYFDLELEEMASGGRREAERCGVGNNFVRVPMDMVKDGLIKDEDFFKAFMDSSVDFKIPELQAWKKKWQAIVKEIDRMDLEIPGYERDKALIEKYLAMGEAVVHHSEIYDRAYDPHYRIMGKEQWEKLAKTIQP